MGIRCAPVCQTLRGWVNTQRTIPTYMKTGRAIRGISRVMCVLVIWIPRMDIEISGQFYPLWKRPSFTPYPIPICLHRPPYTIFIHFTYSVPLSHAPVLRGAPLIAASRRTCTNQIIFCQMDGAIDGLSGYRAVRWQSISTPTIRFSHGSTWCISHCIRGPRTNACLQLAICINKY